MANIIIGIYLGYDYVLGLKTRQNNQIHFPWTRHYQCLYSADSFAKKIQNATKFISLIYLSKPKSLGYQLEKRLYWAFVVRGPCYSNLEPVSKLLSRLSS